MNDRLRGAAGPAGARAGDPPAGRGKDGVDMLANWTGDRRHFGGGLLSRFWERVRGSRHRLLMLDYDGTLAPFRLERSQAQIPPATHAVLRRIVAGGATRVAIVSGRQIPELERLLGPLAADLVGEHGWERRSAGGRLTRRRLPAEVMQRLERAARVARASGWGARLERKRCSLVLHTRGLPPEAARELEFECERLWRTYFECDTLRLHRIHGGVTLRASGHHKGSAVAQLVADSPPGTLAVYLGDDAADEDAFVQILDRGVPIRVGGLDRPSVAPFHLGSPDDVRAFLERWEAVTVDAARAAAPADRRSA